MVRANKLVARERARERKRKRKKISYFLEKNKKRKPQEITPGRASYAVYCSETYRQSQKPGQKYTKTRDIVERGDQWRWSWRVTAGCPSALLPWMCGCSRNKLGEGGGEN